jgi:ABC-type dipeptide/oligopeptide/nickel transport system permease subunit
LEGQATLTEAGLSCLGIEAATGVSWGTLLQNAQPLLRDAPRMAVFPWRR